MFYDDIKRIVDNLIEGYDLVFLLDEEVEYQEKDGKFGLQTGNRLTFFRHGGNPFRYNQAKAKGPEEEEKYRQNHIHSFDSFLKHHGVVKDNIIKTPTFDTHRLLYTGLEKFHLDPEAEHSLTHQEVKALVKHTTFLRHEIAQKFSPAFFEKHNIDRNEVKEHPYKNTARSIYVTTPLDRKSGGVNTEDGVGLSLPVMGRNQRGGFELHQVRAKRVGIDAKTGGAKFRSKYLRDPVVRREKVRKH
jgi:hypothetical protein